MVITYRLTKTVLLHLLCSVECVVKKDEQEDNEEAATAAIAHYPPIKAGHYLLDRLGLMWREGEEERR